MDENNSSLKTFSEKPFIHDFGKCMFYGYLDVFILKGYWMIFSNAQNVKAQMAFTLHI